MATHRQTWLFSSTSTYHSTDLLTARGVAHLVVHGTSGSTSYEAIPPVRLDVQLSTVDMVVPRRDGPRRLHDNDDDDADVASKSYICSIREMKDLGLYRDFITKNCKCMMFFL